jgi:hypothetical protein
MNTLTKQEACALHDALSNLKIEDCTTDFLSGLLKLRRITQNNILEFHIPAGYKLSGVKTLRCWLDLSLKDAVDMYNDGVHVAGNVLIRYETDRIVVAAGIEPGIRVSLNGKFV